MRIGASLAGAQLRILHSLAAANAASALSALRLATGKQFTRPSDGPAAFLHIQSIERDQSAVHVAIGRVNAAANIGSQHQSADRALAALAILQQQEASSLILLQQIAERG